MSTPQGYLSLMLHAHLPYVRHPEHEYFLEEDWLYEAITETYIPLIEMMEGFERDGVPYKLAMSITPPLASMLKDELLQNRYVRELEKLIELAEKEVHRTKTEDTQIHDTALMYLDRFRRSRHVFVDRYHRDLISAFAHFQNTGNLEIVTCGATHGFLPLLRAHEPSVRAQINVARDSYREHFGRNPHGIWLAECAYYPGVEYFLQDADIRYFFVDTHGIMNGTPRPVNGVFAPVFTPAGVAAFGRDIESSKQVWSAEEGYPGDANYREFYRDVGFDREFDYIKPYIQPTGLRKNTGIKYFKITGKVPLNQKQPYNWRAAHEKAADHAGNFMFNREKQIEHLRNTLGRPPVVLAPYDAELFGHWWFEGPQFLDFFIRKTAYDQNTYALTHPWEYLHNMPEQQVVQPSASTWGANGHHEVWLEGSNQWIYRPLLVASRHMTELADRFPAAPDDLTRRALQQCARELLLAQASDWAFIMKTGTMVEYAVKRTKNHLGRFHKLYEDIKAARVDEQWLAQVEGKDNIFPHVNYTYWRSEA